jgi:Flp pilus assembly protein TadB
MLWIVGSILVVVWLVAKFVLHKSGMVHVILLIALASFVIQFVQDRRTKAYERSLHRQDS